MLTSKSTPSSFTPLEVPRPPNNYSFVQVPQTVSISMFKIPFPYSHSLSSSILTLILCCFFIRGLWPLVSTSIEIEDLLSYEAKHKLPETRLKVSTIQLSGQLGASRIFPAEIKLKGNFYKYLQRSRAHVKISSFQETLHCV